MTLGVIGAAVGAVGSGTLPLGVALPATSGDVATTPVAKIGFLSESGLSATDDDEKAAADWFKTNYVDKNRGAFLSASDNLSVDTYKAIWVCIDQEGLAQENVADKIGGADKLTAYVKAGGNVLLTNHATVLANSIGRAAVAPNVYGSGAASNNPDVWAANVLKKGHAIFSGLTYDKSGGQDYETLSLEGAGMKEDHNSLWNEAATVQQLTKATVLASWGQVSDGTNAGLVEFKPSGEYQGTVLACGLAAYEWKQNGATNPYQSNIEKLTTNMLTYLVTPRTTPSGSGRLVYLSMDDSDGSSIKDAESQESLTVSGTNAADVLAGAKGKCVRFDGYSNYAEGDFEALDNDFAALTFSAWVALESYPNVAHETVTRDRVLLCGNLDQEAKSGCGFTVDQNGTYAFEVGTGSAVKSLVATNPLTLSKWHHLVGVVEGGTAKFYDNGTQVATATGVDEVSGNATMRLARATGEKKFDYFYLTLINGLFDEVEFYGSAKDATFINATTTAAALTAWPTKKATENIWRPGYHAMPAHNWMNECHGLSYYNGKYHLFFQKEANGPYMSRQQWGHLTSADLLSWREQPIALRAKESYDVKGCWSGHVFQDANFYEGKPTAIYTGVDYTTPTICAAKPNADDLVEWTKLGVQFSKPSECDDMRDPHIFKTDDGSIYCVVGATKSNNAVITLHKYNKSGNSWTSQGLFMTGNNDGKFYEMPTVDKVGDKWVVTATTLENADGTQCHYWTGSVGNDGHFTPDAASAQPRLVDVMSKGGFGMLSPSICTKDGKTVVMGIVPDKIATEKNAEIGWAHNFSLPREWTVDAAGNLIQKPYSGLAKLRATTASETKTGAVTNGAALTVSGRSYEIDGTWTVGSATKVGYEVFRNGSGSVKVYYEPATRKVVCDMTSLPRYKNDTGDANGKYEATLPAALSGEVHIELFVDHSILDIFVGDRYAMSVRVFPEATAGTGAALIAEGGSTLKSLSTYTIARTDGADEQQQGGSITPGQDDHDGDDSSDDSGNQGNPGGQTPQQPISTAKVALLLPDAPLDDDEDAAKTWATTYYGNKLTVLTAADLANGINKDTYPALWVMVDRVGGAVPEEILGVKGALGDYVKEGGNLLLTNHAVKLAKEIGRIDVAPNIVGEGAGSANPDLWGLNVVIGGGTTENPLTAYDHNTHAAFQGIEQKEFNYGHNIIPLIGDGTKEDHNCMWDLNQPAVGVQNGEPDMAKAFETAFSCTILGTWQQVVDYCCAGMVEFAPQGDFRGKVLTIGVAAYEWKQNDKVNPYQGNIERLTANALKFLGAPEGSGTFTPVTYNALRLPEAVNGNADVVGVECYNLSGQRVQANAKGLVIVVTRYSDGSVTALKELRK